MSGNTQGTFCNIEVCNDDLNTTNTKKYKKFLVLPGTDFRRNYGIDYRIDINRTVSGSFSPMICL